MDFKKGLTYNTFHTSTADLSARPALAGVWFDITLAGRTTEHGNSATPITGWLQFHTHKRLPWSRFEFSQTTQLRPFRNDCDEQLFYSGYISHAQLEAFEKEREEKDFSVRVDGSLSVLNEEGALENWQLNGDSLQMTAQEWLRVLNNSGYKNYLLQELAFPAASNTQLDSVYSHLRRARDLYDKALYKECIVRLRQAEEALHKSRKDKKSINAVMKQAKGSEDERTKMTFEQRLLALRGHTQHALHLGNHTDDSDNAFTRERAKTLLIILSALVELFPEPGMDI